MPNEEESVSVGAAARKSALDIGFKRTGERLVYRTAWFSDDLYQREDERIGR